MLIVGAGPVGLGASLELARFGVPSLVIEKHDSISWHPKTRNLNTRTMEITRGWGRAAYHRLRNIDTPPGWKSPIRFMESATGREFGQIESKGFEGPGALISPAEPVMSSQEFIEEIMLDAAHTSSLVEVRFGVEAIRLLSGSEPDATIVELEARERETGIVETLSGPALVAADGVDSLIRSEVGFKLEGRRDISHMANCYFRADIESHLDGRHGVLFFVHNPIATGVLQPLDACGRWLCQITVRPEDWSRDIITTEHAEAWIKGAAGVEDLAVEVLSVGLWKLNATVIERLVSGRVVFCGDAAHQFPPTGGLGVNTGLQGMHNAMWKLAYCIRGRAGWELLDTYDSERRPVAQRITQQSLENSRNVARINKASAAGRNIGMASEDIVRESRRYGNHLGVEFGERYQSLAVVPDGTEPPTVPDSYSDYLPSACPGCRAPHFWLGAGWQDGGAGSLSSLDLIGGSLTLLAAAGTNAWMDQARAQASGIDAYRIGCAGLQDHGQFQALYGVGPEGAVLIRPDGHVAWRSADAPSQSSELATVVENVLARQENRAVQEECAVQ